MGNIMNTFPLRSFIYLTSMGLHTNCFMH